MLPGAPLLSRFDLWHFSEEPGLAEFVPRPSGRLGGRALVWAVDTPHSPLFWFPRDCPRITFWTVPTTTQRDRLQFFGSAAAEGRIHGLESCWWDRLLRCRLNAYRMPPETFVQESSAPGYWVSERTVRPVDRLEAGDLVERHAAAGIELRVLSSLWPLWHDVIRSSLAFSGSRLAHAATPQPANLLP